MQCESAACGTGESRLCSSCFNQVSHELQLLPALYSYCEAALAPSQRTGRERVRGGRPGSTKLNHAALSAREDIISILASWSSLVVDERRVVTIPERNVKDMSAFLTANLEWLAQHPAANDLVTEIHHVAEAAKVAVDPDSAVRLRLGSCAQRRCNGTAYVTAQSSATLSYQLRCTFSRERLPLSITDNTPPAQARPRCPVIQARIIETASTQATGQLLPTDLAATVAGVPHATIRKWASRGKLTRYGQPTRARYDLHEIIALMNNKYAS